MVRFALSKVTNVILRGAQRLECGWNYLNSPRPLGPNAGKLATIFFDYEGRWASPGVEQASRSGCAHILDVLAKHGVSATFNCVGRMIEDAPDLMRRISDDGHDIASHTLEHTVVQGWSATAIQRDIEQTRAVLAPVSTTIIGFRAPQSRWSRGVLLGLAKAGVRWDAENDHAAEPYVIRKVRSCRLWRIPIRTDDWDFQKQGLSGQDMLDRWKAAEAAAQGQYFAIGFHPWVLAQSGDRLLAFDDMVAYLASVRTLKTFAQIHDLCESQLSDKSIG